MVSYFFGQESLFAFVISKDSFHLRELPTDTTLQQGIKSYRKAILENSSPANFAGQSHELYKRLINPLADLIDKKNLLIIPDGILHYLPFESLVTRSVKGTGSVRYHKLPYLIEKHIINYAPSAGYLKLQNSKSIQANSKKIAAFAPVFSNITPSTKRTLYPDYKRNLNALPLSKKEVKEVGKLFDSESGFWSFLSPSREQADIFVGDTATEAAFKKLPLEKYQYIHLATHAFTSEKEPYQSGILFSASNKSQEDGTLHAAEIYNLQLNAELITLSACNTGIGTLARGEGMISLSRAFQYAGAQNLLVSLWSVSDRSTADLIINFYNQIKEGKSMPAALQKSKLKLISDGTYAHPKYWAPFIFIGQ
jgi:CHAT domain-containing protein